MSDVVIETVSLGPQWPGLDPYLFCVHHVDRYPAGNEVLGPAASLAGRDIGSDFAGVDGWRMYHGTGVPGFPQHPHRGFETVTYVRRGYVDHADSLGATARYGGGDVQWLTTGRGVVHSEMFPLVDRDDPNPLELFQIWLNLPGNRKLVDPYFTMLWDEQIPRRLVVDDDGRESTITVVAGALEGAAPPPPPPDSWAARADADVAIWHLDVGPDATVTLPPAASEQTVRTLYVYDGATAIATTPITSPTAAVVRADAPVTVRAGGSGAHMLMLQGRPIGEPVAQYGPFVMNDRAGIEQAFADYRETAFGGWPFPVDEPVHERDAGRFARHPDGRAERPTATASP